MTIYDVAARAGVSISTVSLALNNPGRVRAGTRARVLEAVEELGFVPKADAVIRARQGVGRIGVIAPFSSFPSFATRLNGILKVAAREGFEVAVYDEQSAAESRLASLPLTHRVDGLVVMSMPLSDDIVDRLREQRIPTVLIELGRQGLSSVTIDDRAGGRLAAERFVRDGREHFAFLGHAQAQDYLSQSQLRLGGFADDLPSAPMVRLVRHEFDTAYAAAVALLAKLRPPAGVFAHDDVLAGAVLRAADELGWDVPGDLGVIGFDDSPIAEPLGLTSVRQPLEESGRIAAETLFAHLGEPSTPTRDTTLALTLVERASTGPVVTTDPAPQPS